MPVVHLGLDIQPIILSITYVVTVGYRRGLGHPLYLYLKCSHGNENNVPVCLNKDQYHVHLWVYDSYSRSSIAQQSEQGIVGNYPTSNLLHNSVSRSWLPAKSVPTLFVQWQYGELYCSFTEKYLGMITPLLPLSYIYTFLLSLYLYLLI